MDKVNFHGYFISRFYPTCEIRKNFKHVFETAWFTVSSDLKYNLELQFVGLCLKVC